MTTLSADASPLAPGALFDGRYQIIRQLGHGGMASVYLARDQELGREVALKVLHDRYLSDDAFLARFRQEAQAAAALQHPNIVAIYDRGEGDAGLPYISMELVQGGDLRRQLTDGPLAPALATRYAREVLAALAVAHAAGIVHRDVKPGNVLIGEQGQAKVTDFGISRSPTSDLTESGALLGTASSMSPEQAQGQQVGPESDVYSTGVLLYELLTGRPPFVGDPLAVASQHVSQAPPPLARFNPKVPSRLAAAVLKALAKDPSQRFPSAAAFSAELERVEEELGVAGATVVVPATGNLDTAVLPPLAAPAPPAEVNTAYAPGPPRRPRWPLVLALAALLALGTLFGYLWLGGGEGQAPAKAAAAGPALVKVPDVVGLPAEEAEQALQDAGLKSEVSRRASAEPEGLVIAQDPAGGAQADKGQTVTLVVSSGPAKVEVPRVVGLTFKEAKEALEQAGFAVRRVNVNDEAKRGLVVAQAPQGGKRAKEGATVEVQVSKGLAKVAVPNVVGQDQDTAVATLKQAGFEADIGYVAAAEPKGTVVAQDPTGGARAEAGATVSLTVSDGSQATQEVPDVVGESEAQATQDLEAAGFSVQTQDLATQDPAEDGVILEQSPAGGSQAQEGATVTIAVGRYQG